MDQYGTEKMGRSEYDKTQAFITVTCNRVLGENIVFNVWITLKKKERWINDKYSQMLRFILKYNYLFDIIISTKAHKNFLLSIKFICKQI